MSTGDGARRSERGFTFVEMIVVIAVTAMLALVVERTLLCTHESSRMLDAVRRATGRGQAVMHELHETVSASRRLFQDDDVGRGYLEALDLSRMPRTGDSLLPQIDAVGALGPDVAGDRAVGNLLHFVEEAEPVPCVADASAGRVRTIDAYRFVCVYPTETSRRLLKGAPPALDLVIWRSLAYPCLAQIHEVEDANERRSVLRDLRARFGYEIAWDMDADADMAFYDIDALGNLSAVPDGQPEILPDLDRSAWGRFVNGDVQMSRTTQSSWARRPVFCAEDPAGWVPDGFEVKIVGPSGARKVWLHLVVESPATAERSAVHASTVIVRVRDM